MQTCPSTCRRLVSIPARWLLCLPYLLLIRLLPFPYCFFLYHLNMFWSLPREAFYLSFSERWYPLAGSSSLFPVQSSTHCDLTSCCYHFTEALLKYIDISPPAKSMGQFSVLIFLDFSAASDNLLTTFLIFLQHLWPLLCRLFEFTLSLLIPTCWPVKKEALKHEIVLYM